MTSSGPSHWCLFLQNLTETDTAKNTNAQDSGGTIFTYKQGDLNTDSCLSYTQLVKQAENNAALLKSTLGANNGSIIVLHFNNHEDNIGWLWSVLYSGAIPAMSTPIPALEELRVKHIAHVDELLKRPIYLTRSHLVPQFPKFEGLNICTIEDLQSKCTAGTATVDNFANPSDTALMMLTSGSTGHAKAVPLTHSQILVSQTWLRGPYYIWRWPRNTK